MIANLITEVCSDIAVEPLLAPLSGERFTAASTNTAPDATADIRAHAFGHVRSPRSLISAFSTLLQLAISIKPLWPDADS